MKRGPTFFRPEMKRGARQHVIVRTYSVQPFMRNPKPEIRHDQRLDSVPVAGSSSNAKSKASNQSTFNGKCGRSQWVECHGNPVSKSKDKTKGTQKFRTRNIAGFNFSGLSATRVLDDLYRFNEEDEIDDHVNDHDDVYENGGICVLDDDDDDFMAKFWCLHDKQDDDDMSFCDVGSMLDIEEDEGWCLLGESDL